MSNSTLFGNKLKVTSGKYSLLISLQARVHKKYKVFTETKLRKRFAILETRVDVYRFVIPEKVFKDR